MSGWIAQLFRLTSCVAVCAACVAGFNPAFGQAAVANPPTIPQLADYIQRNFSLLDTTAQPAADWCIQVETDQAEQWWPLFYNDTDTTLYTRQSLYGNRIRLFYRKNNDTAQGFAAIFIAIDLDKKYQQYALRITSDIQSSSTPAASRGTINFPSASKTICPDFSTFLEVAFKKEFFSWLPSGAVTSWLPGCDPVKSDQCKFVTWNFNGHDHNVTGTIRVPINIYYTKDDQFPPSGKPANPTPGHLTIGFGGNGGAG
jgi:hypothetical protein